MMHRKKPQIREIIPEGTILTQQSELIVPAPTEQKQPFVEVTIVPKASNVPRIKPVLQTIPANMFMPAANRHTIASPAETSEDTRTPEASRRSNFPIKTRRQNYSEQNSTKYEAPTIIKPNLQLNSTLNSGFKKGMSGERPQQLEQRNNIHKPVPTPNSRLFKGSEMVVEGTVTSGASHLTHDPYTKVTDKARKLIESVERKIGSTGGTDGSTL